MTPASPLDTNGNGSSRGWGRPGRGNSGLLVCGAFLVALLAHGGFFSAGAWRGFGERFHQNFILDGRYRMLLDGLEATLIMTFFATLIGVVLGLLISVIRVAHRGGARIGLLNALANLYITVLRGTPVMVQLLIWNFSIFATARDINTLHVAILAFGLNYGAYVAEIFRGGIEAVDPGQMEAARSLGLSYRVAMLRVVLPQAFRNVVPMLFNEFITLLKETSVAGYIGIDDLTRAGQNIQALTLEHSQPLVMVALIYLAMVLVLTELVRRLEKWLHRSRRA